MNKESLQQLKNSRNIEEAKNMLCRQQVKTLFEVATERGIVATSAKVALFVGSILALINYGDRIFLSCDMRALDWVKLAMTYCVPYCVATYGAARYAMRHTNDKKDDTTTESNS